MCLALLKPANQAMPIDSIKLAWESNQDGAGVIIRQSTGSIEIRKGFMRRKQLIRFLRRIDRSLEVAVHLRYATHGAVSEDLCHPFEITPERIAWIHNGVLSGYNAHNMNPCDSDTSLYTEEVLAPVFKNRPDFGQCPGEKRLLERALDRSKGIILSEGFDTIILNEHLGEWVDGIWYSNLHWDWEDPYGGYSYEKPRRSSVPATSGNLAPGWQPAYHYKLDHQSKVDEEMLDGDQWAARELAAYEGHLEPDQELDQLDQVEPWPTNNTSSSGVYRWRNGKRVSL